MRHLISPLLLGLIATPLLIAALSSNQNSSAGESQLRGINDSTDKDEYPDYIEGATPPSYDFAELQRNVVYPRIAQQNGLEGRVFVMVYLSETGEVEKLELLKSDSPIFQKSAFDAIRKTTFRPATVDGVGVPFRMAVHIKYVLADPVEEEEESETSESEDSTSSESDFPEFVPYGTPASYSVSELISHVVYPSEAQENGIEGSVRLFVYLSETGSIEKVEVETSNNPIFEEASIRAVRATSFTPAQVKGVAVKYKLPVLIRFQLN